ncbi:MAG TPA: lysine 5,6-aminomutase subunit alpha, partial [Bacteroidales bacterium]|nr:lysine 5,6-aminomutase subunit alpha [Bacteroidales bacterium]
MRESKLGLDFKKVEEARKTAGEIADQVQRFVENYTTVSVERTLCRLMGIDGVNKEDIPLPNLFVDALKEKGMLADGVLHFLGNALLDTGSTPHHIATEIASGTFDFACLSPHAPAEITRVLEPYIQESVSRIREKRSSREKRIEKLGEGPRPYLYVIVATGNIYEDALQ